MRRIGQWALVIVGVVMVGACRTLPQADEVAQARTHIQTLKFDKPKEGYIEARADLIIHNPGRVKTYIDGVEATLFRGETVVGRAVRDCDHDIAPLDSQRVRLHFKRIRVADLEAAIGRTLAKTGIEPFEIDGVIIYETQTGPLRQPFENFRIQTVLGPKGTGL